MTDQKLKREYLHYQLHSLISGQVQGVLYRASTKEKANELGLVGYAKNVPEGVEVVAEGPIVKLEKFEQFLWQASPMAKVENIQSDRSQAIGQFDSFEIY